MCKFCWYSHTGWFQSAVTGRLMSLINIKRKWKTKACKNSITDYTGTSGLYIWKRRQEMLCALVEWFYYSRCWGTPESGLSASLSLKFKGPYPRKTWHSMSQEWVSPTRDQKVRQPCLHSNPPDQIAVFSPFFYKCNLHFCVTQYQSCF